MSELPGSPASDPINVRAQALYEESLIENGVRKMAPAWANASWADRAKFHALAEVTDD